MVCQQCQKREAKVHYTQIINGKKVEMYLCTQCASENETMSFDPQLSLVNLLWGFPGFGGNSGFAKFEQPEIIRCDVCGMSFDDFRKGGKLGCAHCYSVFRDNLAPILRRLHGSAEHTGKTPDKIPDAKKSDMNNDDMKKADSRAKNIKEVRLSDEIDRLKAELSRAIEGEHYERAAELRDRIRSLENSGNVNGGAV
jgi:protein arginine kinase activator